MSAQVDDEHECPRPLEQPAGDFSVGGMFFSPAGRWETITDRSPHDQILVRLHTDRTGTGYCWQFWRVDRMPYLPSWTLTRRQVAVHEVSTAMEVTVGDGARFGGGHVLITARQVRGQGWQIYDRPDGTTAEQVTVPSKARARGELTRRARAHAKRLGVPLMARGGAR